MIPQFKAESFEDTICRFEDYDCSNLIKPSNYGEMLMLHGCRVTEFLIHPVSINGGILCLSVKTLSFSGLGFFYTDDKLSKLFYALSCTFAVTASGFATIANMKEVVHISKEAFISEGLAETFYYAAENAKYLATQLKNNKNKDRFSFLPSELETRPTLPGLADRQPFVNHTRPLAFIFPSASQSEIYIIIFNNLISVVKIYGYYKIIRITYKKVRSIYSDRLKFIIRGKKILGQGRQFIIKRQKVRRLKSQRIKSIRNSAQFFVRALFINKLKLRTNKNKNSGNYSITKSCLFSTA